MEYSEQTMKLLREVSAAMIDRPIETERLLLRPFRQTDFADYFAYAAQKEQQRLSGNPEIETEAEAREVFEEFMSTAHPPLSFAMELKSEERVVGNFSIGHYPFLAQDEKLLGLRGVSLSLVLNEDYWRMGLMTELLHTALPWFFREADLDYVNAGYFAFNEGSRRLQEKSGFKPYIEHIYELNGKRIPTKEMILFREDLLM